MIFDNVYGILSSQPTLWWSLFFIVSFFCGYLGLPLLICSLYILTGFWLLGVSHFFISATLVILAILNIPLIRQRLLSAPVMKLMTMFKLMPVISETERTALEAGTTWVDGELFSGQPNFKNILKEPYNKLTEKEKKFISNQVEKACQMVDDQETYRNGDLSPEVWAYLKKEKFLGLIVPEEFGGLGFSALAHSEIIAKLSSASIPLAITVMVPNSLGPSELLLHYGTKEQKDYYLPRLANGTEIPCFGLTEVNAGSDAGSLVSSGEVFKGEDGKLYLKISWKKRYITLGAVSTLVGLAIRVHDPKELLGRGKDLGITCVLVPSETKGVNLKRRHDPLGVPFINSPIEGDNVVVSISQVIGGQDGVGRGWRMLMECLAAGRCISLPAQSLGNMKRLLRIVSAYSGVRKQFGTPIGSFEGIGEILAKITALTYLAEGARIFTLGAVDKGFKPAVISAVMKYQTTELSRMMINGTMDIMGGAAISQGPRNLVARQYIATPIPITVEGANILTRTMIIFGQGAIRCHPYAYQEVKALENHDLKRFDSAFFGHIGHVIKNSCRTILLSLTRGRFVVVAPSPYARHLQKLSWVSASYALLADIAMATLGGQLKFKEKITGRFADILSWMYLISSAIRRYEADGRPEEHTTILNYSIDYGFNEIQIAFQSIYANMDSPVLGFLFKYPISFWSRFNTLSTFPNDKRGNEIVHSILTPGKLRDSLTEGIFYPKNEKDHFCVLEKAFVSSTSAHLITKKIVKAMKLGTLKKGKIPNKIEEAISHGVITREEAKTLHEANELANHAVEVDSYTTKEYDAMHTDKKAS